MSIAGLSAAFWLRRTGWTVTLLERSPEFRDGGQNVDVRGVAHEVLDRMGLTDAVAEQHTTETGTVIVDGDGQVTAEMPNDGPDAATAELEVLRGDFARIIRDALPPDTDTVYGETIETVADDDNGVTVTLAGGRTLTADLLVVAEGVRSTTRELVFGDVERNELGITMVFGTIPRTPDDDRRWRWHNTTGGRQVHLRPDNHGTTRAMLSFTSEEDLAALDRADALDRVRERYADDVWQAARILDGFAASDDVYVDQLTQITMPAWHRGRVCLVGDAAWCVTPIGGGGASLALTAGYVLAAYLSTAPDDDLESALAGYDGWMRPLVDQVQTLPPGLKAFAFPQTKIGLAVRTAVTKVLFSPPLKPVAAKMTEVADSDRPLPACRTID